MSAERPSTAMTTWLSEKMSHRHTPTNSVTSSPHLPATVRTRAARLPAEFGPRFERRALAPARDAPPFFQGAMDSHSFLEKLFYRRVKARQSGERSHPSQRDPRQDICAGESVPKQPGELDAQFSTRETLVCRSSILSEVHNRLKRV
jgi:hypothetical protein